MNSRKDHFYVVAQSAYTAGGIYRYAVDDDGGVRRQAFRHVQNSNWLEVAPDGSLGYAGGIVDGKGVLYALPLRDFDNPESPAQTLPVNVQGCICHIAVHEAGRRLYTANYVDGSFSEIELDDRGWPLRLQRTVKHSGHGPNAQRQEQAHVHQVNITPDGKFLAVVDLGTDAIYAYPLDCRRGADTENVIISRVTPPGSGPRHLVFSPDGKYAYLVTELGNTLVSLEYSDGRFQPLMTCTTLPEGWHGDSAAAAIRIAPDGKALFITNRGHNSAAIFGCRGGEISLQEIIPCGGDCPRDGNFIAGGKYYLVSNQGSNAVTIFQRSRQDNKLCAIPERILLPSPMLVVPG